MPIKNSSKKPVRSFRLSVECVRQLKDLSGNMGRSEGDVVEVAHSGENGHRFRLMAAS